MSTLIKLVGPLMGVLLATPCVAADTDWNLVGKALGKSGNEQPGGIYRVGLPRTDLHVTLDGIDLKPGFALGGWVAFEQMSARVSWSVRTESQLGVALP